jgi:hypothetical protein
MNKHEGCVLMSIVYVSLSSTVGIRENRESSRWQGNPGQWSKVGKEEGEETTFLLAHMWALWKDYHFVTSTKHHILQGVVVKESEL